MSIRCRGNKWLPNIDKTNLHWQRNGLWSCINIQVINIIIMTQSGPCTVKVRCPPPPPLLKTNTENNSQMISCLPVHMRLLPIRPSPAFIINHMIYLRSVGKLSLKVVIVYHKISLEVHCPYGTGMLQYKTNRKHWHAPTQWHVLFVAFHTTYTYSSSGVNFV